MKLIHRSLLLSNCYKLIFTGFLFSSQAFAASEGKIYYRFQVDFNSNKFSQIYLDNQNQVAECKSWIENDPNFKKESGIVKRRCTEGDCWSKHVKYLGRKQKSANKNECLKLKDILPKNMKSLDQSVQDLFESLQTRDETDRNRAKSLCRSRRVGGKPGCFVKTKKGGQRWESCVKKNDKNFSRCDETNGIYSDVRLGQKLCYGGRHQALLFCTDIQKLKRL